MSVKGLSLTSLRLNLTNKYRVVRTVRTENNTNVLKLTAF